MRLIRLAFVVCACVVIAACSIGKPIPQATTYVIELPAAAPTAARRPETLRMGNVHVAAPFAGDALVYRMDEVRYTADPYNAFIAEPARYAREPHGPMARPRGAIPVRRPARERARGALHPRGDRE